MANLTGTLRGVLLLDDKTYQRLLTSANPMKVGIYFLLVCLLIAAFPTFVTGTIDEIQPFTADRATEFQEQFMETFRMISQFMPIDPLFMQQFEENFQFGLNIAVAIDALPRPLPYAVGGFFTALGSWLSLPFTHLASWLSYTIWVLLFAKIFGGRGGTNRFLGLTALYAVPNLLGFFGFIPYLGGLFRLVGMVWGWIVYVKGVHVSQEFTGAKAVLITIAPLIVGVLLILLVTLVFGVALAAVFSGGQ